MTARYATTDLEAPTPAGGQTHPTAPWTPGVPGPAGRNGPSEAPRRPMVGPGRCQAAPTGPSRSPPALQVPGATSRPLRAPHDRPGGHMRPDLAAGRPARVAADRPCTCTMRDDPPTGLACIQPPSIAPGVLLGHWGGSGAVGLAHSTPCGLNPWDPSGLEGPELRAAPLGFWPLHLL